MEPSKKKWLIKYRQFTEAFNDEKYRELAETCEGDPVMCWEVIKKCAGLRRYELIDIVELELESEALNQ